MGALTHYTNDETNLFVCPITELETNHVWTDHGLSGVENSCRHCKPGEEKTVGQMLHELSERRKCEEAQGSTP